MKHAPAPPATASDADDARGPSKSQRKRDMHALQDLGKELTELSREQLARIELPEAVREAVRFAHTVTSHEGRRRHMQYLGKLMRQVDAVPLRAALDDATGASRAAVHRMHAAERWRDRLLDDDGALTEWLQAHPQSDPQALRASIRAARRERDQHLAPRHMRALYRTLHAALAAAAGAPAPAPEEDPAA